MRAIPGLENYLLPLEEVGNSKINDLSYADDVDLIAETAGDVDILATNLKEMAGKVGLEINENKTKLLKLTKGDDMRGAKLPIAGMDIEYVQQFKYLGSIITSKTEIKTEVEARINAANKCYYSLLNILKKRSISRKTKVRIYTTIIRPIVLYGCEAWPLNKTLEKKILVFENTALRRIVGPIYDNELNRQRRRQNIDLRDITQVPLITDVMKRHRLKWAGHVARMPPERYPKIILDCNIGGRRFRGRPRKR